MWCRSRDSPRLRERRGDIPLLVEYFARTFAEENNFKPKRFSEAALSGPWPNSHWKGNVRELPNIVERLLIMTDGETIERGDLPEPLRQAPDLELPEASLAGSLREYRDLAEREYILAKLKANNWNISQTAREIDTPRSNLYKKLEQYGIKITAGVGEAGAVPAPEDDEDGKGSEG